MKWLDRIVEKNMTPIEFFKFHYGMMFAFIIFLGIGLFWAFNTPPHLNVGGILLTKT